MSPLPQHSPLVKAAHAGYSISPPRVGAGMFTPVGGTGAAAMGIGLGHGAPARPGKGKGKGKAKGMIRA
jgi:hypothetical protein